jgi:hypothetical protein
MWRHYFYVASLFLCGVIIFMWRHYFYVAPLFLFGLIIFVWRHRHNRNAVVSSSPGLPSSATLGNGMA